MPTADQTACSSTIG